MQYTAGTVTVSASTTVTGSSTLWAAEISAGDAFKVAGEAAVYTVASVESNTSLTLTAAYAGTAGSGLSYQITRDFTPNFNLPEINAGDKDWPDIMRLVTRMIDATLQDHEDRIAALE